MKKPPLFAFLNFKLYRKGDMYTTAHENPILPYKICACYYIKVLNCI